jgi:RHS repeat-associated protein
VRDIINSSGSNIDHVDFSAFGSVLGETSPTSGDRTTGFAMLERDTVTGLNLAVYREENPGSGRWDSQDPLSFRAYDTNLYRYVFNQSPDNADKDGEGIRIPIIAVIVLFWNPTPVDSKGGDNIAVTGILVDTATLVTLFRPTPGCFVAGTLVATELGPRPIEGVQVGESVCSYDFSVNRPVLRPALSTMRRRYGGDLITIALENGRIQCTGDHPFWVSDGAGLDQRPHPEHVDPRERASSLPGRSVDARDLNVGDALLVPNGSTARIEAIAREVTIVDVFNLCVSETNNYCVGENGLLVHNRPGQGQSGAGKRRGGNWKRNKEQIQGDCDDMLDKIDEIEGNPHHRAG